MNTAMRRCSDGGRSRAAHVVLDEGEIVRLLSVAERHDEHVAALWELRSEHCTKDAIRAPVYLRRAWPRLCLMVLV